MHFTKIARAMLLLLACCLAFSPAGAAGGPNLVVPKPHFEFAPVLDGEEVTHDFVVKNTGDAPLVINKVQTG